MIRHRYPVFIPTRGRADSAWTIRGFDEIGVDYRAVIEASEFDAYAAVVDPSRLLVLPFEGRGLTAARNWIWDFAAEHGYPRFWTFDDNIGTAISAEAAGRARVASLFRFHRNLKVPCYTQATLAAIEDWTDRYENVVISGHNYFMFASRKSGSIPPITLNIRVYSNMLIDTFAKDRRGEPFRNVTYYNDDTDLCLRVLKDGGCTALFNAFLIYKRTTMTVAGGNTPVYLNGLATAPGESELMADGRYRMAKELKDAHPDVTTITRKWGRWQHHVDYSPFKSNRLRLKEGASVAKGANNFGMKLHVFT